MKNAMLACLFVFVSGFVAHAATTTINPPNVDIRRFGTQVLGINNVNGAPGSGDVVVSGFVLEGNSLISERFGVFDGLTGSLIAPVNVPVIPHMPNVPPRMSRVPDANGDGKDDVVIGIASLPDDATHINGARGRCFLYNGATGALLYEVTRAPKYFMFGQSLCGFGDLDGDGRGDFGIGYFNVQASFPEVAVFSGSSGALIYELVNNATINGLYGNVIKNLDDINGDGRSDFAVADYINNRVELVSGVNGAFIRDIVLPNQSLPYIRDFTTIQDVNGNGGRDLALSSQETVQYVEDGRVHIIDSKTGAALQVLDHPHPQVGSKFGSQIDSIEDIDGNSVGEVIIASFESAGGQVFLMDSLTGELVQTIVSPLGQTNEGFGFSITSVPPANDANQLDDVVIGAPYTDDLQNNRFDVGRVYVFSSKVDNKPPSQPVITITPQNPTTSDNLVGSLVTPSVDPDGQNVTYGIQWYDENGPIPGATTQTLSSALTERDMEYTVVATPSDGIDQGDPGIASVIVQNSVPESPLIEILPSTPMPGVGMAARINLDSLDPDADTVVYLYEWFESIDGGATFRKRPELSGNLVPYDQGQPYVSDLFIQLADEWLITVTPIEARSLAKKVQGQENTWEIIPEGQKDAKEKIIKGNPPVPIVGKPARAAAYVRPDVDQDGVVGASDLIFLRENWKTTKEEALPTIRQLYFDPSDDPDDAIGLLQLMAIQRDWQYVTGP